MQLIDLIYPAFHTVSIVGTYKNAGKTVTMNEIISEADDKGIKLGLISTGRDGERRDVLTNTDKPPVYVRRGTIVTTLETAIKSEFAGIEIMMVTDYSTPLGRVVIGRVTDDGYVEISGPNSSLGIKKVCEIMSSFGAELILIDGSLDRRASAAPYVSDATVLATGAALSRNMDMVIQKTMHIVDTYSIPPVEDIEIREIAADIINMGKTAIINKDREVIYIDTETSLKCGDLISAEMSENTEYIILSGAATVSTLNDIILNRKDKIKIIVKDATRIFVPDRDMQILLRRGMELMVAEGINIIAVTINPYSPEGYYFDPVDFLNRMKGAISQIPVFDCMQGGN